MRGTGQCAHGENSPRVVVDKDTMGSSGLWALLMGWVAYLVCVAGAVYRASRLPFVVRSSCQQRTANWKSQHLEHQAAGGNGQKQDHAEEEYSAGHVSSLHIVSKPAEQERKTSPAQHTGYVLYRQGQHHLLPMMTAAIAISIKLGLYLQPARVLVDSSSEHPPLISQDLADRTGMTGVRTGGATQTDGACLQLFNIGCLDLAVNSEPISHNFLSAPLSHYDIILGESWLRQHHGVLDYAHNNL